MPWRAPAGSAAAHRNSSPDRSHLSSPTVAVAAATGYEATSMRFDARYVAAGLWITALYWFIAAQFVNAAKSSEGVLLRLTHTVPLAIGFLLIFHQAPHAFIYGPLHHAALLSWAGVALT